MKILLQTATVLFALIIAIGGRVAQAETIAATLTGNQEVPVVATVAGGEFRGFISSDEQSIDYELTYSGLQGPITTQAHIHVAQPSVNGGIVFWFCQSDDNQGPAGTPNCTNGSGTFTGTITATSIVAIAGNNAGQQIGAQQLAKVIAAIRAGNAYTNVHTNLSPGGEIRGQIRASRRP
jgi:CHRD domain